MKLSVIIIAKNEEKMIGDCLKSVNWAEEIILVDSSSTDKTVPIAKRYGVRVIQDKSDDLQFSRWRNKGLKEAKSDWVLYLDADERVAASLRDEIKNQIAKSKNISAYAIPRRNFLLGKELHFGGWWPDYVKRLFLKKKLKGWKGALHEEPVFKGKLGHLKEPMIHLSHRDLSSMIEKTRQWSKIEAKLLYDAGHPPVTWWRILRVMLAEFWERGVKKQGFRDGTVGWIEIIFQIFSRFMTYARLWEIQEK